MKKFITNSKLFYHTEQFNSYMQHGEYSPISFEVHPTNKCNQNCYYCSQKKENAESMELEAFDRVVKFSKGFGVKSIYFSGGGEPCLNEHIWYGMRKASDAGLKIGIITNLSAALRAFNFTYIAKYCQWIRISIDASDRRTYKKIRRVDSYDSVSDNIWSVFRSKKNFGSRTTIGLQVIPNKYTYWKIVHIVKSLRRQFPFVDYIQVRPIELLLKNEPYTKFQLFVIGLQLKALSKINGVLLSDKWSMFGKERKHGFRDCYASFFLGTIVPNGDYYICCHTIGNESYRIGNIYMSPREFKRKFEKVTKKMIFCNTDICPVGCRGSVMNKSVNQLLNEPHKDFI